MNMNGIDFQLLFELNEDLKESSSNDRDNSMGIVLYYLTSSGQKYLAEPLFELVRRNHELSMLLNSINLTPAELINQSELSVKEKNLLLFYVDDLRLLTGRGSGPKGRKSKTKKPSDKDLKTFNKSLLIWSSLITMITNLVIAYNGYETNQINRENIQFQNELKLRELEQRDRELNILENKNATLFNQENP